MKINVHFQHQRIAPSISSSSATSTTTPETNSSDKTNDDYHEESVSSDFEAEEDDDERYDFSVFQQVIEQIPLHKQKLFKNGTRASLTFSNARYF